MSKNTLAAFLLVLASLGGYAGNGYANVCAPSDTIGDSREDENPFPSGILMQADG